MLTAQLEAWAAVHTGAIDSISRTVEDSLADAALARMMIFRRRAIAAQVIGEFFGQSEHWPARYLEGRAPQAPTDPTAEIATAKLAGETVVKTCGAQPPLLYERAMLAEIDGRPADAVADLEELLDTYPGFVMAALALARLLMAAGQPGRAIEPLAIVEREAVSTREGAALLADGLRAIGLHGRASRYDLAALTILGYMDSRGNDCAPVDIAGNIVNDYRMPEPFLVDGWPDGRILYNDRGVYYLAGSAAGVPPSELRSRGLGPAAAGLPGSRKAALSRALSARAESIKARFLIFLSGLAPEAWDRIARVARAIRGWASRLRSVARRAVIAVIAVMLPFALLVYRSYKRLPRAVRYWNSRLVVTPLRQRLSRLGGKLFEVPERDRLSPVTQVRLGSGILRIFGLRRMPSDLGPQSFVVGTTPHPYLEQNPLQTGLERIFGAEVMAAGAGFGSALGDSGAADQASAQEGVRMTDGIGDDEGKSPELNKLRLPRSGELPPVAQDVLNRLMRAAEHGRNAASAS